MVHVHDVIRPVSGSFVSFLGPDISSTIHVFSCSYYVCHRLTCKYISEPVNAKCSLDWDNAKNITTRKHIKIPMKKSFGNSQNILAKISPKLQIIEIVEKKFQQKMFLRISAGNSQYISKTKIIYYLTTLILTDFHRNTEYIGNSSGTHDGIYSCYKPYKNFILLYKCYLPLIHSQLQQRNKTHVFS